MSNEAIVMMWAVAVVFVVIGWWLYGWWVAGMFALAMMIKLWGRTWDEVPPNGD